MLRSMKDLEGYGIHATDGTIGHVRDFYFDDDVWVVRYLIVEAGSWLSSRRVLISPMSISEPDWNGRVLPVSITKEQVKNSPDVDTDQPHLRSCKAVMKYHIEANDGYVGHVQGLLIDEETWAIRYMVVDTNDWWVGHLALIAPQWIQEVRWTDTTVGVTLTRQAVRDAPKYDAAVPLSRDREADLYKHHGRPCYWVDEVNLENPQFRVVSPAGERLHLR